jgi:hypothetical protein
MQQPPPCLRRLCHQAGSQLRRGSVPAQAASPSVPPAGPRSPLSSRSFDGGDTGPAVAKAAAAAMTAIGAEPPAPAPAAPEDAAAGKRLRGLVLLNLMTITMATNWVVIKESAEHATMTDATVFMVRGAARPQRQRGRERGEAPALPVPLLPRARPAPHAASPHHLPHARRGTALWRLVALSAAISTAARALRSPNRPCASSWRRRCSCRSSGLIARS